MLSKRRLSTDAVLDDTVRDDVPQSSGTLADALSVIDDGLTRMAYRQIVTSDEVSDLLLDLRVVLLVAELEAVGREAPSAA